jgi:hypothetical protein
LLIKVNGGSRVDELINLRGGRADAPAPEPSEPVTFDAPPIKQRSMDELAALAAAATN